MLDPDRTPKPTSLTANIVAAVLLTIFALPVLLVAGCFPAMILSVIHRDMKFVVGGVCVLAIGVCAVFAHRAPSAGYRIGFIIAAIEVALFGLFALFVLIKQA